MINFQKIKKVKFPQHCVIKAYDHLRLAGRKRLEGVVLFAGRLEEQDSEIFCVEETIVPKQLSMSLEEGLLYAVDGEELHRINVHLHEHKMMLIAQLHSHPGSAYHSQTDDNYAIITKTGGLSIVVPNFGMDDIDTSLWAVYRLDKNDWVELSTKDAAQLIELVGI